MAREDYAAQVRLILQLLPLISKDSLFALKGGTAINLFYRNLPRLSLDIDLTYLPIEDRQVSLKGIDNALSLIMTKANGIRGIKCTRISGGGAEETRVQARQGSTSVKIECSPVTRGVVNESSIQRVRPKVEEQFGFAEANVVSFEDAYGGKLHATLSRQHPRDIFDIHLLYKHEEISEVLFNVFLVYLSSSSRPPHELLNPNLLDIDNLYEKEFLGMPSEADKVALDILYETRKRLIEDVQSRLTGNVRDFLLSMQSGDPDFNYIGLPHAQELPAIKWKLLNIRKLISENPKKHASQTDELMKLLH